MPLKCVTDRRVAFLFGLELDNVLNQDLVWFLDDIITVLWDPDVISVEVLWS